MMMRGSPGCVNEIWICGEGGVFDVRFCFLVEREGFLENGKLVARMVVQRPSYHF
jgi:hypothetical protein